MLTSFIAEMEKIYRRPATWILVAVWGTLAVFFDYVIPYISYANPSSSLSATARQALLARMMPDQIFSSMFSGFPLFGGMIALIFGVLVVGSEYGWGTLKTILIQGANRTNIILSKLLALGISQLLFVLVPFLAGTIGSLIIANVTNSPIQSPSTQDIAQSIGFGWVTLSMWTLFGCALAMISRGTALAIGLGLVYIMFERFIAGFAAVSDLFATLAKGLPGPNAGSLAAILAPTSTTPGVSALVGTTQALIVLFTYIMVFAVLSSVIFLRRDVL
jgi:ABC-2 type transport system permease protein